MSSCQRAGDDRASAFLRPGAGRVSPFAHRFADAFLAPRDVLETLMRLDMRGRRASKEAARIKVEMEAFLEGR